MQKSLRKRRYSKKNSLRKKRYSKKNSLRKKRYSKKRRYSKRKKYSKKRRCNAKKIKFVGGAPLPTGWEELEDHASGRTYYHIKVIDETQWVETQDPLTKKKEWENLAIEVTQWERPGNKMDAAGVKALMRSAPAPSSAEVVEVECLPPPEDMLVVALANAGWTVKKTRQEGKEYYYNKSSGKSSGFLPDLSKFLPAEYVWPMGTKPIVTPRGRRLNVYVPEWLAGRICDQKAVTVFSVVVMGESEVEEITCPPGKKGGDTIMIEKPLGRHLNIVVPERVSAGNVFSVTVAKLLMEEDVIDPHEIFSSPAMRQKEIVIRSAKLVALQGVAELVSELVPRGGVPVQRTTSGWSGSPIFLDTTDCWRVNAIGGYGIPSPPDSLGGGEKEEYIGAQRRMLMRYLLQRPVPDGLGRKPTETEVEFYVSQAVRQAQMDGAPYIPDGRARFRVTTGDPLGEEIFERDSLIALIIGNVEPPLYPGPDWNNLKYKLRWMPGGVSMPLSELRKKARDEGIAEESISRAAAAAAAAVRDGLPRYEYPLRKLETERNKERARLKE